MRALHCGLVITALAILGYPGLPMARDYPEDSAASHDFFPLSVSSVRLPVSDDQIPWPTLYGVHQTNAVNAAFDCFGTIGMPPRDRNNPYPFWPNSSFESPPGSGHKYLFAGTIWVGGIVGSDTVVTTGFANWGYRQEMYPSGYSSVHREGSVLPLEGYPTLTSYRAEFDDTVHDGIVYSADRFGRPYRPLRIALANRSHSFVGPYADECILYDVLVTNIGAQTIREGYFGIQMDPDIYSTHGNLFGNADDLAGSIRSERIAYTIDNDGDPAQGAFSPTRSPTKILALKYVNSSFVPRDTNFNWWVSSSVPVSDFGPRQKAYPRDFGAYGIGTPYGDGNEYYLMSTPEWDYDQVMTATILSSDPQWEYPDPATSSWIHRGGDTRILLSIGPFELPSDSSVRVQFAVFTADSVHTDPFILDFVDIAPELYVLTLNLPSASRSAAVADSLGALLADPVLPPTGLHVVALTDSTTTVAWDRWVYPTVDSCDVYLSLIPDTAFRYGGTIPIWYHSIDFQLVRQVGEATGQLTLTGLSPGRAYACNIAWRSHGLAGAKSEPLLFRTPDARKDAQLRDSLLFVVQGSSPMINWAGSVTGAVDHFNVYRFADTTEARGKYQPFYSLLKLDISPIDSVSVDSSIYYYYALLPYAQVLGDVLEFEDPNWSDGNVYAVTAVDSSGTEFPFSPTLTAYRIASRTKDICVLTNSGGKINFVLGSTLKSFYTSLLNGYQYDIFSYVDSAAAGCGMYQYECIDWRALAAYRTLFIDDGMKDALFSSQYEDSSKGFRRYLQSGGTIVYFGSFSSVGGYRFNPTTEPTWYDLPYPLVTDHFGVDSVFYTGIAYYHTNTSEPYVDSLFGFVSAQSEIGGAPDLHLDAARHPFTVDLAMYWPEGTAPSVSTFKANDRGEVCHTYRSASPATSVNEGQPVGVVTRLATGQTFLFGFHLWYMEPAGARQLVDWIMGQVPVDAPDESKRSLPSAVTLSQNYPNPFNPRTTIVFSLDTRSYVRLEVYNLLGQQVRMLIDGTASAGEHAITFDGKNSSGQQLSSGVYLYRLATDHGTMSRKMILLK